MTDDRQPALHGVRILVVDDDDDTRELLTRVLEVCGAEVMAAGSAHEAYAIVSDRLESLRAGFQSHMAKPIDPEQLVEVMVRLTGRA